MYKRQRLNYAYDIRVFYHYLMEYNPVYRSYSIEQFQPADLEKLSAVDIEEYMDYLKVYKSDDDALRTNGEKGLARKMSALRSFYGYYYKHQVITQNPTLPVSYTHLGKPQCLQTEQKYLSDPVKAGTDM